MAHPILTFVLLHVQYLENIYFWGQPEYMAHPIRTFVLLHVQYLENIYFWGQPEYMAHPIRTFVLLHVQYLENIHFWSQPEYMDHPIRTFVLLHVQYLENINHRIKFIIQRYMHIADMIGTDRLTEIQDYPSIQHNVVCGDFDNDNIRDDNFSVSIFVLVCLYKCFVLKT